MLPICCVPGADLVAKIEPLTCRVMLEWALSADACCLLQLYKLRGIAPPGCTQGYLVLLGMSACVS